MLRDTTTPPTTTCVRTTTMGQACFFRRFSQWVWPPRIPRTVSPSSPDEHYTHQYTWGPGTPGPNPRDNTPRYLPSIENENQNQSQDDSVPPAEVPPTECAYPCKACQAWGVTCDRQRPRCAHCLDQQILCFYVAPVVRKRTRSKRKTPSVVVSETHSQSQSLPVDA